MCSYYIIEWLRLLGLAVIGQPPLSLLVTNGSFLHELLPHQLGEKKYRYGEHEPCQRIHLGMLETLREVSFIGGV